MQQIRSTSTTEEILRELGQRIERYRLQQNRTLADVAASAGVGVRTAKRAEAGERPTLETVVRLLRALDRLDTLNAFLPAPLVSPLQLADLGGHERQRAGTPRRRPGTGKGDTKAEHG